jgi:hypothetical protein
MEKGRICEQEWLELLSKLDHAIGVHERALSNLDFSSKYDEYRAFLEKMRDARIKLLSNPPAAPRMADSEKKDQ